MKETQEATKLEFLMTLNDNIIVQRFFSVKDYNPYSKNSLELHDYIKGLKEWLEYDLKLKSSSYLLENKNEIINNPTVLETSYTDGPESFNILLKEGDKTICHRIFDAKLFPPKIRYTVDIRPHIKTILNDLTDIFSQKNLTFNYLGFNLKA